MSSNYSNPSTESSTNTTKSAQASHSEHSGTSETNSGARHFSNYSSRTGSANSAYSHGHGSQSPPTPPTTPSNARSRFHAANHKEQDSARGRNGSQGAMHSAAAHHDNAEAQSAQATSLYQRPNGNCKYTGLESSSVAPSVNNGAGPYHHGHAPLEAYMHHILGPPPVTSQGPSPHHPASQYSHLTSSSVAQGPSAWSRFVDSHPGYPPVGHQDAMNGKEQAGLDFYRNYGTNPSDCHVRRGVPTSSGASSFMDSADSGYCAKALSVASSSLLAGIPGCTVFGHDPFAAPDSLGARGSSQLDGQGSCAYGGANIGHPFLPPR